MRWLSAVGKKTLDGRRPGQGINPVAVDEAVVGAAMARWTTAPMKREEAMKGSWSGAADERRPSLAVDDGVGVAAPARWRMGWRTEQGVGFRRGFSRPRCTNGWADGMAVGNHGLETRLSEMWGKLRKYPPPI